jgi:hypothetical protein
LHTGCHSGFANGQELTILPFPEHPAALLDVGRASHQTFMVWPKTSVGVTAHAVKTLE